MKKLSAVITVLLIISAGIYFFNIFSGGYVTDVVKNVSIHASEESKKETVKDEPDQKRYNVSPISLYEKLSQTEKKAYDTIYKGMKNHKDAVFVSRDFSSDKVFDLVSVVLCEHPEIFYTGDSCRLDGFGRLEFVYKYDKRQSEKLYEQIKEKTEKILSSLSADMDDYEKSVYIYDYLCRNVYYDYSALDELSSDMDVSTLIGPLLQGRAVCTGYAKAYQYLLSCAGVESLFVFGTASTPAQSGDHAWIVQQSNGDYYFTDPTWGDSFDGKNKEEMPNHAYFCITTREIKKTHKLDKMFDFPEFKENRDSYFVREGTYFEEYDKNKIKSVLKKNISSSNFVVEIKFKNKTVYENAYKNLISGKKIYYILKEIDPFSRTVNTNKISYSGDSDHYVLTIFLKSA